jgi:hypothetical protein
MLTPTHVPAYLPRRQAASSRAASSWASCGAAAARRPRATRCATWCRRPSTRTPRAAAPKRRTMARTRRRTPRPRCGRRLCPGEALGCALGSHAFPAGSSRAHPSPTPSTSPQVAEALRDAKLALMKDLRKEEDAEAYDALAKVGGREARKVATTAGSDSKRPGSSLPRPCGSVDTLARRPTAAHPSRLRPCRRLPPPTPTTCRCCWSCCAGGRGGGFTGDAAVRRHQAVWHNSTSSCLTHATRPAARRPQRRRTAQGQGEGGRAPSRRDQGRRRGRVRHRRDRARGLHRAARAGRQRRRRGGGGRGR